LEPLKNGFISYRQTITTTTKMESVKQHLREMIRTKLDCAATVWYHIFKKEEVEKYIESHKETIEAVLDIYFELAPPTYNEYMDLKNRMHNFDDVEDNTIIEK